MNNLPLVVVTWDDAWVRADEPVILTEVVNSHKPMRIISIGWLLRSDEIGVSIANECYHEDNTYRGRTFIPKAMVFSVEPYKAPKVPRKRKATLTSESLQALPSSSQPA